LPLILFLGSLQQPIEISLKFSRRNGDGASSSQETSATTVVLVEFLGIFVGDFLEKVRDRLNRRSSVAELPKFFGHPLLEKSHDPGELFTRRKSRRF
jgi:hypothetical protein